MPTNTRKQVPGRPHATKVATPTLATGKRRKVEERARRQAMIRARQRRRLGGLGAVLLVIILAYVLVQRHGSSDTLALDTSLAGGAGMAWSPDGAHLALNGDVAGRDVHIWNTASGKLERSLYGDGRLTDDVAWSPNGAYLAVAAEPDAAKGDASPFLLQLWRTSDWTVQPGTEKLATLVARVARRLAFAPDGRLAAQNDDDLVILSVPSLRRLATVTNPVGSSAIRPILAWSPDGKTLVVGIADSGHQSTIAVGLLDGTTYKVRRILTIPGKYPANVIGGAAWSPDGKTLAVGGLGGRTTLFNPLTGKKIRDLDAAANLNSIDTMAWAPDGRRLAAGGNGTLAIWDTRDGQVLEASTQPVNIPGSHALLNTVVRLAWSPDGKRLAISGDNALPVIWTPPALKS